MAQAAWCSACQRYVWVTPEGTCQNGHEAEFLAAFYDSEAAEQPAAPPAEQPAAPPAAPPADWAAAAAGVAPAVVAAPPLTPQLTQHMWLRLAAFAIDYLFAGLLGVALAFFFGVGWGLLVRQALPHSVVLAVEAGYVAIFYAYFIVSEGAFSTTAGKGLLGFRVRSAATGVRISWRQSLKRNVGLVADLVFFGLVGLTVANGSRWRQRIGDRWAGTVVVRSTAPYLTLAALSEPVGAEPGTKRLLSWRRVGIGVAIVVLLAMVIGAVAALPRPRSASQATGSSSQPSVPPIDMSSITSDVAPAGDEKTVTAADGSDTVMRVSSNPNIRSNELDTFIAEQYPDYRVLKVVSFPDQYDKGRLGMNYLLQSKTEPRFRLLVSVAQLKQSEAWEYPDTTYDYQVGRVLSTDGTFSKQAQQDYPDLRKKGQAAIVKGIVAKLPATDSIVEGGWRDGTIQFNVEYGKDALVRAMQDESTDVLAAVTLDASPPIGTDNSQVDVTVEK